MAGGVSRPALETLSISVRASPETNDHEVVLRSEEGELISRFGPDGSMGLDPDELLVEPCPLLTANGARPTLIGRCCCGDVGCGPVEVSISTDGAVISWTTAVRTTGVRFDAAQYRAEVLRALADRSWETPDRTVARLIRSSVDRARLAEAGLEFSWASGRVSRGMMTLALVDPRSRVQRLVEVPWQGEPPEVIAEVCCAVLREGRW